MDPEKWSAQSDYPQVDLGGWPGMAARSGAADRPEPGCRTNGHTISWSQHRPRTEKMHLRSGTVPGQGIHLLAISLRASAWLADLEFGSCAILSFLPPVHAASILLFLCFSKTTSL